MPQPVFSVIIPVFNRWDLTSECLKSLREHTPGSDYEVIVVDNASGDETPAHLPGFGENLFGHRFRYLRFEENRNFGPACNAGAKAAEAPLLFFLNNDTLMTPDWLPPLLKRLENPAVGMVGPLLLYEDNLVQHMGVVCTPSGFTHLYQHFPKDHQVVHKPRELQVLTAAAILLTKELFFDCGGFFEGYCNGFEDIELSLRVRQAGKKLVCETSSVIYHLESQSPGRLDANNRNAAILQERCGNDFYIDIHRHGLGDGFAVTLEEHGGLSLQLPEEQDAALVREAVNMPPRDIYFLLKKNPLWRSGYDILSDILEKAGKFQEALLLKDTEAIHYFNESVIRKLLRLAVLCNNQKVIQEAEGYLKKFIASRDPKLALHRVRKILDMAARYHDSYLINLYSARLEQLRRG